MATTITANGINFPDGSAGSPSIGGTDTNTGLFTGSDIIGFSTGGSERLRIDSSGHLLLGTTTAAITAGKGLMMADAAGARIKLCDSDQGVDAASGFEIIASNGGTGYVYNRENQAIVFGTNNTEVMRITHEGSVGIGTTNSTYELEIHDSSGAAALRLKDGANNVITDLIADSTGGHLRTTYNHSLRFSTNQVERMRIDTSGRVGIKNTSMSSFNDGMDDLVIGNGVNGTSPGMTIYSNSSDIGTISFTDDASTGITGLIQYRHNESPPYMRIMVEGTQRASFTTHGGIAFNSDTAAANTLDEYEEGTWTPTLLSGNSLSFSSGRYVKIGAMVYAFWEISVPSNSSNSHMIINNTPFTSINHNASCGGTAKDYQQYDIENGPIYHVPKAHTQVQFYKNSGQNFSESNGSGLNFRGCTIYQTET